jgi:hypothetical protein
MRTLRPTLQPASCSPLQESRETRLSFRIVRYQIHEHADSPLTLARLLRSRRERPRRRAAKQRDELAALHAHRAKALHEFRGFDELGKGSAGHPNEGLGRAVSSTFPEPCFGKRLSDVSI